MIFLADEVILYFPTSFNRCALKLPLRVSCVPGAKAPEAFSGASDQKGGHCRWQSNAATSQRRGRMKFKLTDTVIAEVQLGKPWVVTLSSTVWGQPRGPAWW